jgi:hypothetical protein
VVRWVSPDTIIRLVIVFSNFEKEHGNDRPEHSVRRGSRWYLRPW